MNYLNWASLEKNVITLIKNPEDDLSKWRDPPHTWMEWFNNMQMLIIPKFIYKFNTVQIKFPTGLLMYLINSL